MLSPPLLNQKISDRPVSEPASNWAQAALDPIISTTGVTTPGLHVPGAFPDPYPKSDVVKDVQYVKDTAISALQSAKEYVSTGVEDVKRLMEDTGDTVGEYLPQSVNAYLPHHTTTTDNSHDLSDEPKSQDVRSVSLKDSEGETHPETSQNEHPESSGGAGTISPGPPGVSSVAIPPDEHMPSQVNGLNSETLHSGIDLPEERRQRNPFLNDAPAAMTEKAFPGVKEEAGVGYLPEERTSRDASNGILHGTHSSKVQDRDFSHTPLDTASTPLSPPLPTVPDENSNATGTASSTYASHPVIPNTTARTYPLASDGFKFKGVPLSKGFQQELDQESSLTSENFLDEGRNLEKVRSDVATAGHGSEAAVVTTPAGPNSSSAHAEHETTLTPHRKKPGFMNKLKEEVKGISGRLSHKKGERSS